MFLIYMGGIAGCGAIHIDMSIDLIGGEAQNLTDGSHFALFSSAAEGGSISPSIRSLYHEAILIF
jgi:hypothetical protein